MNEQIRSASVFLSNFYNKHHYNPNMKNLCAKVYHYLIIIVLLLVTTLVQIIIFIYIASYRDYLGTLSIIGYYSYCTFLKHLISIQFHHQILPSSTYQLLLISSSAHTSWYLGQLTQCIFIWDGRVSHSTNTNEFSNQWTYESTQIRVSIGNNNKLKY